MNSIHFINNNQYGKVNVQGYHLIDQIKKIDMR